MPLGTPISLIAASAGTNTSPRTSASQSGQATQPTSPGQLLPTLARPLPPGGFGTILQAMMSKPGVGAATIQVTSLAQASEATAVRPPVFISQLVQSPVAAACAQQAPASQPHKPTPAQPKPAAAPRRKDRAGMRGKS